MAGVLIRRRWSLARGANPGPSGRLPGLGQLSAARRDRLGRLAGIGGRDDRPSHHDVARPGADGFGRPHRPALIVLVGAGRRAADARRDDREVAAAARSDRGGLLRRRHDAVEPGRPAPSRASVTTWSISGRCTPTSLQRGVVHAGEHGDADDERPAAGPAEPAVSAAARAAACIIGTPPEACTLIIQAPVARAASTACATVFGMSWNFRSRKTRVPRFDEAPDERRALRA